MARIKTSGWALLPTLLLLLGTSRAEAQPCDVGLGDEIDLATSGTPMAVRMAWDRVADVPAVLWYDLSTNALILRRHLGPDDADWESPQTVETGSVAIPAPSDVEPRLWRWMALAYDGASEPHVVFTGEATPGDTKLYYTHHIGSSGWSEPEALVDLPPVGDADYEPWVEADFDSHGRLHVVYHCYGGGTSTPSCAGKIRALYREQGTWVGPELVFQHASGMDLAVGDDDTVHVVTLHGGGNQHQVVHKSSPRGDSWPQEIHTQITNEPSPDCIAGPVSCWPSIATARGGRPFVAYGVDPDPCCTEPPCDWADGDEDEIHHGGHISLVHRSGGTWNAGTPTVALPDVALHASLPEMIVDPVGVRYVVGPNWSKRVAFKPLDEPWGQHTWSEASNRWFFLDSIATGAGGWVAYPRSNGQQPSSALSIRHFFRTGACAEGPMCDVGQERSCGLCGVQICGGDWQWGACADQGQCYPEDVAECDGQPTSCSFECQWATPCGSGGAGGTASEGGHDAAGGHGGISSSGGAAEGGGLAADEPLESGCACRLGSAPDHRGPMAVMMGLLAACLAGRRRRRLHPTTAFRPTVYARPRDAQSARGDSRCRR